MNLLYGEIAAIEGEEGLRMATVRVAGARKKVSLGLVTDAACGDTVLLCDGVAIAKVLPAGAVEPSHVSRHPG